MGHIRPPDSGLNSDTHTHTHTHTHTGCSITFALRGNVTEDL